MINKLSTHLKRDKKVKGNYLEQYLEDWGALQKEPITQLAIRTSSPIITLNKSKVRRKPLEIIWIKNQKNTYSKQGHIPNYMPHHRISKINKVLHQLESDNKKLWLIIVWRYREGLSWSDISHKKGITRSTFFRRLLLAKTYIAERL